MPNDREYQEVGKEKYKTGNGVVGNFSELSACVFQHEATSFHIFSLGLGMAMFVSS